MSSYKGNLTREKESVH